jgi:predicted dehydrogenase
VASDGEARGRVTRRGVIVGFGFIGQGHLRGYQSGLEVQIVGVCDTSPSRRRAAEAQGLPAFADISECLRKTAPDFIDICTPPSTHRDYMEVALDQDIHALCEKPMFAAGDMREEDIYAAAGAGHTVIFPAHNYRHAPVLKRIAELRTSAVGNSLFGHMETRRVGHARGVADWYPDWRRDEGLSLGGILIDHGPHTFYVAEFLADSLIEAVSCSLYYTDEFPTTDDSALIRLKFQNSAEFSVVLTWGAGLRETQYNVTYENGHASVVGDELGFNVGDQNYSQTVTSDFNDASHSQWFAGLYREFAAAMDGDHVRYTRLEEAWRIRQTLLSAQISASEGGAWCNLSASEQPSLSIGH